MQTKYFWGTVLAGLVYAGAASAQEVPTSPPPPPTGEVLNTSDLEHLTVGAGIDIVTLTTSTLNANNSGNSVTGETVGSGDINIGTDAFSGYSGLANFVINTGHNNNLQASMNVTVVLGPPEGN